MEALIANSPTVPGLLTEYILKGKDNVTILMYCIVSDCSNEAETEENF